MQFYIIDEDPVVSATHLPDYALQKVNIREGWQILSDIGHMACVQFDGQNKLYSASHALTRSFATKTTFPVFIAHYNACCDEYLRRYAKPHKCITSYCAIPAGRLANMMDKLPNDMYESGILYMCETKADLLSIHDLGRMSDLEKKQERMRRSYASPKHTRRIQAIRLR